MAANRTNSAPWDLLVELDRESPVPAHVQLEAAIRDGIRSGRLAPDGAVPASRRLAEDLGLSRGVVVEAYQQLAAEGYLVSTPGGYTRVASGVRRAQAAAVAAPTETPADRVRFDFRYGRPDVSRFPRAAWLRAVRAVLTETPHDRLSYLDGRGAPELRIALADYLNRVRGTWASPEQVVACNGYAQAVSLVLPVLARAGVRRLAVEDPSDGDTVRLAEAAGLDVVAIPVTPEGIDVDALERSDADAVVVTPAHHFPTGGVMSPERRSRLLAWAAARGGFVIEDDYDAEYRYDSAPVGALQGLAPDHVIYAGTASKTLAPGLRLGWLVLPERLVAPVARWKFGVDRGSPVLEQLAFARFLGSGDLDRHLRRMRPLYRRRRDALLAALAEQLPELEPVGIAAGLHVFAWLPPDVEEAAVLAAVRRRGVRIEGLADLRRGVEQRGGLLFGYGQLDPAAMPAAVAAIRAGFDEVRRSG